MKKLIVISFLLIVAIGPVASRAEDGQKAEFWVAWEKGDYAAARDTVLDVAAKSPGYLFAAYYLHSLAMKNGEYLNIIDEEIGLSVTKQGIEEFRKDLAHYLPAESPARLLAEAIIKYIWDKRKNDALNLVLKALARQESALGHYLSYCFRNEATAGAEALQACLRLRPEAAYARLMLYYNRVNARAPKPELDALAAEILRSETVLRVEDYRNLIQVTLGQSFVGGIGPSGPNDEPYFGELYAIEDWEAVERSSDVQKILLAYALGIGGGQNTADAEKTLAMTDEGARRDYAALIDILRAYESFHDYQYDQACEFADQILQGELDREFYFIPVYDLGYQFEEFFRQWRRDDRRLIDRAIKLYERSLAMLPAWSKAYTGYVYLSLGRSQYYGGLYAESLQTLETGLDKAAHPLMYVFICLDHYRLGNAKEGAKWENEARRAFKDNPQVMTEFEEMLSEATQEE